MTIPDRLDKYPVADIEHHAFRDCSGLTNIAVDSANRVYSSQNGVLFDKGQTTLLQFPCGQTGSYVIPRSVTSLESQAFYNCNLDQISIPASVTNINPTAFGGRPGLTAVTVDAANPNYTWAGGVLFDKKQTLLIH